MTTPDERSRAVLHTRDFLEDLLSPARMPGVPDAVREEARRLLQHYPSPANLGVAHRGAPLVWGPVTLNLVWVDTERMGGRPCFTGTRVPIDNILADIDIGTTLEELQRHWPFLTEAHIQAARDYLRER